MVKRGLTRSTIHFLPSEHALPRSLDFRTNSQQRLLCTSGQLAVAEQRSRCVPPNISAISTQNWHS